MNVNGIDLGGLCHETQSIDFPDTVPGRVVQIDADFLAYQVSAEKKDEEKSLSDMYHNADVAIETLRLLAGAEEVVLHLTPKGSDKGDRYNLAILKEYQGNRKNKEKPRFLHLVREWMHKERDAILHFDCEADDGMAMAQYKAIEEDCVDKCVIASKDKDLCMVPGLQLDWDTGAITETMHYGDIWIDDTKSTKKVKGFGHAFFWAQMLMGDAADNISGIPVVDGETMEIVKPGKKANPKRKPSKCGPMLAYEILKDVKSNKEAFDIVKDLYRKSSEAKPFLHWQTGEEVKWGDAFLSEGYLLWMRRRSHYSDFTDWLGEIHAI